MMKRLDKESFQKALSSFDSEYAQRSYLLAFSGGIDSVVLSHLLKNIGLNFALAHVNYQLRGEESQRDSEFAKAWAETLEIPLYKKEIDTLNNLPTGQSIQMYGRNIRYEFFDSILSENNYSYLLTAHHADDQIEHFFLQLQRSAGIKGLSGMPQKRDAILRPLLPFSKESIRQYAQLHNLSWREDASNADSQYNRNFIRNEVLPLMEERDPQIRKKIENTMHHLREVNDYLEKQMEVEKKHILSPWKNGYQILCSALETQEDFKLRYYFQEFGFSAPQEIRKLLKAVSGSKLLSQNYTLYKDREYLYLIQISDSPQNKEVFEIKELPATLQHPFPLKLSIERSFNENALAVFDAEKVSLPLFLRHRKEGDIFYPIGMEGSKKLSKFFKDEKIPIFEKGSIWILTDNKDDVLYVFPNRQDRRNAANAQTNKFLTLTV